MTLKYSTQTTCAVLEACAQGHHLTTVLINENRYPHGDEVRDAQASLEQLRRMGIYTPPKADLTSATTRADFERNEGLKRFCENPAYKTRQFKIVKNGRTVGAHHGVIKDAKSTDFNDPNPSLSGAEIAGSYFTPQIFGLDGADAGVVLIMLPHKGALDQSHQVVNPVETEVDFFTRVACGDLTTATRADLEQAHTIGARIINESEDEVVKGIREKRTHAIIDELVARDYAEGEGLEHAGGAS